MTHSEQFVFGVGERAWELGPELAIGLVMNNVTVAGSGRRSSIGALGACSASPNGCGDTRPWDGGRVLDEVNGYNPLYVAAIDVVKADEAHDKGDYVQIGRSAMGLFGTVVITAVTLKGGSGRKVPNPNGKKGGTAHQAMVAEVAADVKQRGLNVRKEHRIKTPGGAKPKRFVDVVGLIGEEVVEMHQIGKQTHKSIPVAREVRALNDLERATGTRPTFHPYNTKP
jgi:hypothetical protein